uniref:Cnidarian restricted protein n=1 Tax=Clytia hemisphaerica TaxID=252671 RepID=A0A7M5U5T4_9CNID
LDRFSSTDHKTNKKMKIIIVSLALLAVAAALKVGTETGTTPPAVPCPDSLCHGIHLLWTTQQKLLPPMLKRISLLSSLLAIVLGIQRKLQPMFVQQTRRLCHHTKMAPSHHLRLPRQMPSPWTTLQWKH